MIVTFFFQLPMEDRHFDYKQKFLEKTPLRPQTLASILGYQNIMP